MSLTNFLLAFSLISTSLNSQNEVEHDLSFEQTDLSFELSIDSADRYSCNHILDRCFGEDNYCRDNVECQADCLTFMGCDAHVDNGPPRTLVIPRVQPHANCPTRVWKPCFFGLFWCEAEDSGNIRGPRFPVCHEGGTETEADDKTNYYYYGTQEFLENLNLGESLQRNNLKD